MKSTAYTNEQIQKNEEGWIFYDSAFKCWKEIFRSIKGQRILDIGCGSGTSLSLIKLFNPELQCNGFEGSNSAEAIWRERSLEVTVGDIYQLPFAENSFDTVYSSHVLEHLEHPKKAVLESVRVASKRIIHIVPSGNVEDKNFGSPHLHIFDRVSFKDLFKIVNIEIEQYRVIDDNHMNSLCIVLNKK